MSKLKIKCEFHSWELGTADLPVEVRKPSLALVARGLASQEFEVPPGVYDVTARLPGGQELFQRVEVTDVSTLVSLAPEPEESSPREGWEVALLLRNGGRGLSAGMRQLEESLVMAAAAANPTVRARLRLFEGNLLTGASVVVPETAWAPPAAHEPLTQFSLGGTDTVRIAQLLQPGQPALNVALPADAGHPCRLVLSHILGEPLSLDVHVENVQADALLGYQERGEVAQAALSAGSRAIDFAAGRVPDAPGAAETLLYDKVRDPIAAAVGAYALLRFGDLERLHDWTNNLQHLAAWLPDGAAIRGEHLARKGEHAAALESFLLLAVRGLPLFSDGLTFALDRLRLYTGLATAPFPAEQLVSARELRAALQRFAAYVDFRRPVLTFTGLVPEAPDDAPLGEDLDSLGGLDLSEYLVSLPARADRQEFADSTGAAERSPATPGSDQDVSEPASSTSFAPDRPPHRRLRVYAFDPSLGTRLETAAITEVTLKVPWEHDTVTGQDVLQPGPVGEYLEVVDVDPASGCFYEPVDLDHPYLLAQDGLAPSEGNPQFHQQMVYAVAMTTIRNFERALGRLALWSPRSYADEKDDRKRYVQRLRIYPHALREANAYYSPKKKALLFGYFPAADSDPGRQLPGALVFTCLSHDVVAHETTHALLDGMHQRFVESSNPDSLAFHEAFADIVAIFQHFTFAEVLRHQIARTRGDLAGQNLLGELAQEFGWATGRHGALRDALGALNQETGRWAPAPPDPQKLQTTLEPHDRGALLVAAVFDAFLTIYKSRIEDLLRIGSGGTGLLPAGELHPDLVNRLADQAAKSAQHVLNMCIRALDYCPPLDITFGDYLRALITADRDLVRDDDRGYRIAVIEAFRRRGIYPRDVRSLSEASLRWQEPSPKERRLFEQVFRPEKLQELARNWDLSCDRREIYEQMERNGAIVHGWLRPGRDAALGAVMGLDLTQDGPRFQIHSVRPTRRISPDGEQIVDLVIEIAQQRRIPLVQGGSAREERSSFVFRGGCTLLVDLETGRVRYCIRKRLDSQPRQDRQRRWVGERDPSLRATYMGRSGDDEPFAFLHRSGEEAL